MPVWCVDTFMPIYGKCFAPTRRDNIALIGIFQKTKVLRKFQYAVEYEFKKPIQILQVISNNQNCLNRQVPPKMTIAERPHNMLLPYNPQIFYLYHKKIPFLSL